MRHILVLGLMMGLGATGAVADTAGRCSIRAGHTEERMSFSWERGDCADGTSAMTETRTCSGLGGVE